MSPDTFTPGPWTASDCGSIIAEAEDTCIAVIENDGGYEAPPEQQKANARLIAAAPDLYAELQHEEHWISNLIGDCVANRLLKPEVIAENLRTRREQIRAAINKATGEEARR